MTTNNRTIQTLLSLLVLLMMTGCKKFLDEKPAITDVIPKTLDDLQSLLDNTQSLNVTSNTPSSMGEILSDNYYVTTADFQPLFAVDNKFIQADVQHHLWLPDALPGESYWRQPYMYSVFFSNIVLDQLPLISSSANEQSRYDALKGSALFYRSFAFYSLAQLFCKPYSQENAGDLGIVLRVTSNVSEVSKRATVQETYDRITSDLKEAVNLLPPTTNILTRPSKLAAYAMLARVYLSMRDYANADQYANLALQIKNSLIDYNTLIPVNFPPISSFNPEVIFHDVSYCFVMLDPYIAKTDTVLYAMYDDDDLRKTIYFMDYLGNGSTLFLGSYAGTSDPTAVFDGLATDELYLIRAECAARAGNKDDAMTHLNALMIKRWANNGSWVPFTAPDANAALNMVLDERRKELVWRGSRWSDIRRLNLEGRNITLKRIIDNVTYTLPPNDLRSVLLIPWDEINRSGIEQNPR